MGNWAKKMQGRAGLMLAGVLGGWSFAGQAMANADLMGQPTPGAIDFQPAATEVKQDIADFHNFVLVIITVITLFVLALLIWVVVRYNRRANPTPKTFTHNVAVEVLWTVIPVFILVAIAWKSFPLLYEEERVPPAELTIKAIGNSWNWQYEYPDNGAVQVYSNMLPEDQARAEGRPALLAVDNPIYVPVDTVVRIQVTSNDVIHSWAMPAFGVKEDAIPGRINEGWFNVNQEGIFYGQCSELCGKNHAYMPIEVRAVSRAEFNRWIESQGGTAIQASAAATPAAAPAR
ncbi:MAG: cytochrome c oxidase subunit II [Caulobacterales bacterium]